MKVYCVVNGVASIDLDNVVYASTSKSDAERFAREFGFLIGHTSIKVLDVAERDE